MCIDRYLHIPASEMRRMGRRPILSETVPIQRPAPICATAKVAKRTPSSEASPPRLSTKKGITGTCVKVRVNTRERIRYSIHIQSAV